MERLKKDFHLPYVGDADVRFLRYLTRCCKSYYGNSSAYDVPYVTIVQSSVFGKSRILFEVAKKLAKPNENLPESNTLDARLLALDTNPQICDVDSSPTSSFPPFVFTYNMDIFLKQLPGVTNLAYKALVLEKDA
ncbi:hypothetical protein Pcac1_g13733 [Phytophthora cactorum]|nr:hypothetical protein Pcac1_g13733 [Phytophthora cactorum]